MLLVSPKQFLLILTCSILCLACKLWELDTDFCRTEYTTAKKLNELGPHNVKFRQHLLWYFLIIWEDKLEFKMKKVSATFFSWNHSMYIMLLHSVELFNFKDNVCSVCFWCFLFSKKILLPYASYSKLSYFCSASDPFWFLFVCLFFTIVFGHTEHTDLGREKWENF